MGGLLSSSSGGLKPSAASDFAGRTDKRTDRRTDGLTMGLKELDSDDVIHKLCLSQRVTC